MPATNLEVGRLIVAARERRGWTQADLIAAMGKQHRRAAISKWENGRGVGVAALLAIVRAMPEVGDGVVELIRRAQKQ